MRVVLYVAGGIAALLASTAIAMAVVDRRSASAEEPRMATPTPTPTPTEPRPVPSTEVATPVPPPRVEQPKPPIPPNVPLAYEASGSPCFGDCVSYKIVVAVDGEATVSAHRAGRSCGTLTTHVAPAELAALAREARALHIETMKDEPIPTDVPVRTTAILAGDQRWSIDHLEGDDALDPKDPRMAAMNALHDHIERVTGATRLLKTCEARRMPHPL